MKQDFQRLHLAAVPYGEDISDKTKFIASSHRSQRSNLKPHRLFRNWSRFYKFPWICIFDIGVFVLYIFLSVYHQLSTITFTQDFSDAIKNYFLGEIEIPDVPKGIPIGSAQIYFVDDFKNIFLILTNKIFEFENSFPAALVITTEEKANLHVDYINGSSEDVDFTKNNTEDIMQMINDNVYNFEKIELSKLFHIEIIKDEADNKMILQIIADFVKDDKTNTIFMDISHSRINDKLTIDRSLLKNFYVSLPMVIIFMNICAIIIVVISIVSLIRYSKIRANEIGLKQSDIFWSKFDKWGIYTIITHSVSLASSILYIFVGQDIEKDLPPFLYVISLAALLHSILLIRYLKLINSTKIIIHVLIKSTVQIFQFLVGCIPIYLGFWAFGICYFGHLTENFATPLQSAIILFCVMHGDSIKDMYDSTIIQNSMSPYIGFFYTSLWVAFSLLLMFNITISIVSEILTIETYKSQNKRKDDDLPSFNTLAIDLALANARKNN